MENRFTYLNSDVAFLVQKSLDEHQVRRVLFFGKLVNL